MMFAPPEQYIPQRLNVGRPVLLWMILVTGSLHLVALIVAAPLAQVSQHGIFAATLYQGFSHVCHQKPERSFFLLGQPLAVCARCTGIYVGFAVTTLFYPLVTSMRQTSPPDRKWLMIAAAPLAIDFVLGFFGIWANTHSSRFLTAALLGAVVVFYVMPALTELSQRLRLHSGWSAMPERSRHGNAESVR